MVEQQEAYPQHSMLIGICKIRQLVVIFKDITILHSLLDQQSSLWQVTMQQTDCQRSVVLIIHFIMWKIFVE